MTSWIAPIEGDVHPAGQRPAFWLRDEFDVGSVGQATLRVSARGLVEVFVNGERVGDELLPGFMQYRERIPLRAYDITSCLRGGANAIAVLLADGWFRGQTGVTRAADQWGSRTSLWLEVESGGQHAAATSGRWRTALSHIARADLIGGQSEDRRRFDPAVLMPGFDTSAWAAAEVVDVPGARFAEYAAPPVRRVEELPARSIDEVRPGVFVADFGQNFSGWCRLDDLGSRGTVTRLTHGEWLDADGDVTTVNLDVNLPIIPEPLPAGQVDEVVSAGIEGDVFEPRLTTHGFRYVRIEGHPGPLTTDAVTGIVVHSDLRRTGWFSCGDDLLNRLHDAAVWSLRSNMCEIPTDCPQRERAGWIGDWQIFAPTAAFLYDVESFTRKWLTDVRIDQREDGALANISPSAPFEGFAGPLAMLNGSAGWGDVIVLAPWALYEAYGDTAILEENWDAMRRWIEFGAHAARTARSAARVSRRAEPFEHEQYLWDTGFHWGEWLEPDVDLSDFPAFVAADKSEVATAYLAHSAATVARIGEVLGKPDHVTAPYRSLAAGATGAWRAECTRDGVPVTQTQAAHVRALAFDLVPDASRAATASRLVDLIRAAGTTVGTGFLSTGMLLPTLADAGHLDVAYELLQQTRPPSWLHMIERGATTVWERWEGVDAEGVPHESLNHASKGAVVSFLHRYVAGLRPTSAGYRTFEVRPRPGGGLTHAELALDAPLGRIEVEWHVVAGTFELRVVVPDTASAHLVLPDGGSHDVGSGTHRFTAR